MTKAKQTTNKKPAVKKASSTKKDKTVVKNYNYKLDEYSVGGKEYVSFLSKDEVKIYVDITSDDFKSSFDDFICNYYTGSDEEPYEGPDYYDFKDLKNNFVKSFYDYIAEEFLNHNFEQSLNSGDCYCNIDMEFIRVMNFTDQYSNETQHVPTFKTKSGTSYFIAYDENNDTYVEHNVDSFSSFNDDDSGSIYYECKFNGILHNMNGPAIIFPNGDTKFYIGGIEVTEEFINKIRSIGISNKDVYYGSYEDVSCIKYTLTDKSKIEVHFPTYYGEYYDYDDEPANIIEFKNKSGKLHREGNLPAVYTTSGLIYYINGKLHRDNGPAVYNSRTDYSFYKNGKIHNEQGPAVHNDEGLIYYLDDKKYDAFSYYKELKNRKIPIKSKKPVPPSSTTASEPAITNAYDNTDVVNMMNTIDKLTKKSKDQEEIIKKLNSNLTEVETNNIKDTNALRETIKLLRDNIIHMKNENFAMTTKDLLQKPIEGTVINSETVDEMNLKALNELKNQDALDSKDKDSDDKISIKDMFISSQKEGFKRVSIDAVVSLFIASLKKIIESSTIDDQNKQAFATIINSDLCKPIVKSIIGYSIPYIDSFSGNNLAETIANECRAQSAESIQKEVIDKIISFVTPALQDAFSSIEETNTLSSFTNESLVQKMQEKIDLQKTVKNI